MSSNPPLVLVDGSSYLFRAYHALPPLTTTTGQPTGATKGVINMIRSLIKQYPDSRIVVVFDAKGKTFRDDIFSEYKAQRPPMPDDLRVQIEPIHSIVRAMGLPLLIIEGVEADDVIGTLAQQAWEQQIATLISTGDKDMAQLVNDHVTLLNTMTNETLDRAGVEAKFGLPPERIVEYLALMGDKVDNIPGVPGVGPKTAVKWLLEYGNLDALIARADEVKGKAGENLRANLDKLALSRELATIKLDVALDFGPAELQHAEADMEALLSLYKSLEFRSWIKELEDQGIEAEPAADIGQPLLSESADDANAAFARAPATQNYVTVSDEAALQALCDSLARAERLALFPIAEDGHYKRAPLTGLGLSTAPGEAFYLPLGHDMMGAAEQLPITQVLERLQPFLESQSLFKVGHDLKHCTHVLARYGI
ncbi:MAG TPA: DNA polymerase I, partial [Pseudomonadaceae bacterium]|nr:DNA polymerase I [Pseudomonadaceae bacterium]